MFYKKKAIKADLFIVLTLAHSCDTSEVPHFAAFHKILDSHTALVLFAKFSNNVLSIVFWGCLAEICFKLFEFEISLNGATFIEIYKPSLKK